VRGELVLASGLGRNEPLVVSPGDRHRHPDRRAVAEASASGLRALSGATEPDPAGRRGVIGGGLDGTAFELLRGLPPRAREAVEARVVDERDYPDIARDLRCSEAVARKRVSRGLAALRDQMEENT
jgi:DNA-directed RNA polymerase specialized sigma24 family protein